MTGGPARDSVRADTAPATLWRPTPLALDSTSDLPWLEVLKDPGSSPWCAPRQHQPVDLRGLPAPDVRRGPDHRRPLLGARHLGSAPAPDRSRPLRLAGPGGRRAGRGVEPGEQRGAHRPPVAGAGPEYGAGGAHPGLARQRPEAEHQWGLLLGQEPGLIERGKSLEQAVQAINVPDSLPGDLLLRRPDVLSARRDWQGSTARIGVAVGNRLPKFTVSGLYGTQRPDFSQLFTQNAEVYQLAGGISIPLFTGGRLINEERAARARAEQARNRYEQAVLSAAREASDALTGLRLSRDQLAAQETQTQALRRAYALAEKRYESGVSSYLEVLDAQRGLFSAELALVQVERQYLSATVQLYRALGGGWE